MTRKKTGWLKHAFAVDKPGPAEPTAEQQGPVDRICREVVRRRLTTPVLLALETLQPMNYVGSQAMHFFNPFVSVFVNTEGYRHFATFLERRGSVEYLCKRIEALEAQCEAKEKSDETSEDSAVGDDPDASTDGSEDA